MDTNTIISSDLQNEQVLKKSGNDYEVCRLLRISEQIEAMGKFNHIEVVRILSSYSEVTLTENKYGIHINLTDVSNDIIEKLCMFIKHVQHQEKMLSDVEQQKEDFKNTYFIKDNKEIV
jgi:hypothetical protein